MYLLSVANCLMFSLDLETLLSAGGLQQQLGVEKEEAVKSFLSYDKEIREKELKILVYLENEEGNIGIEVDENKSKSYSGSIRKGKILLEQWTLTF